MTTAVALTRADLEVAATLLDGVALRTPMTRSRALGELVGGPVHLKCENLQRAGSFKIRGAYTRISRLSAEEKARGVIAASAGNHAQGVALAAQMLGLHATVVMPDGAAIPKVAATRGYGAEVLFSGRSVDEALVVARARAEQTGEVLIHPFDHPDIVTGQGTVGLEILQQVPDVRTVVVPIGGGGLAAGIAVALAGTGVRLVGVQAAGAAAYPASLVAGHPIPVGQMTTMADGIAIACPGETPFGLLQAAACEVVTVGEEDLSRGLLHVIERSKLVVEPSGAAGVAALMAGLEVETPAVVVLSGGNVDPLLLLRVVRHGLAAAGRYLQLRVRVADTPGHLAGLLTDIAAAGGNVLHVAHEREVADLAVDEVQIGVQVETRGADHAEMLLGRLRDGGYRLV